MAPPAIPGKIKLTYFNIEGSVMPPRAKYPALCAELALKLKSPSFPQRC